MEIARYVIIGIVLIAVLLLAVTFLKNQKKRKKH